MKTTLVEGCSPCPPCAKGRGGGREAASGLSPPRAGSSCLHSRRLPGTQELRRKPHTPAMLRLLMRFRMRRVLITWPQIIILLSALLLGYGNASPYQTLDSYYLDSDPSDTDRILDTNRFSDFMSYALEEDERPYKRTAIISRLYQMAVEEEEDHPRKKRPDGILGLDNMDFAASILERGRNREGGSEGGSEETSPCPLCERPRVNLQSQFPSLLGPRRPQARPTLSPILSALGAVGPTRRTPFKPAMSVGLSNKKMRQMLRDTLRRMQNAGRR